MGGWAGRGGRLEGRWKSCEYPICKIIEDINNLNKKELKFMA